MLPKIWGKNGWKFLHFVTLGYPINPTKEDKEHYYQYFHLLQYVLPCKKCGYNLGDHLEKYPLTDEILSSRDKLVCWGIDLHNIVNHYTGKPMLSYDEAFRQFDEIINKKIHKKKTNKNILNYFLLFVSIFIIILLLFFFLRNKKKLNI